MKNYLSMLSLMRKSSQKDVEDALEQAMRETLHAQAVTDAEMVLTDPVMRSYYERTHLQYEAIAAALKCLEYPNAQDTHRWTDRLVEFDTEEDDNALLL